jgi:hypothetical protein
MNKINPFQAMRYPNLGLHPSDSLSIRYASPPFNPQGNVESITISILGLAAGPTPFLPIQTTAEGLDSFQILAPLALSTSSIVMTKEAFKSL